MEIISCPHRVGEDAWCLDCVKARIAELEAQNRELEAEIEEYDDATLNAPRRIAELEEKIAALQLDNATLAGLALDASNIFSYTEPGNAA